MPDVRILASDLDGTFFPLDGDQDHPAAMRQIGDLLTQHGIELVFVTGRSFGHVLEGVSDHNPPLANAIICDVGTQILRWSGSQYVRDERYHADLRNLRCDWEYDRILAEIAKHGISIEPQPADHQSDLKTSFYYDAASRGQIAAAVEDWIQNNDVPVSMTISVDPFTNRGLLDLLPKGANKGFALAWYLKQHGVDPNEVIFAGDTGNDTAAMTCGVRGILVANADDQLRSAAIEHHGDPSENLFIATQTATAGVLEGLRHYLA